MLIKNQFLLTLVLTVMCVESLKPALSWKQIDFEFPDEDTREQAINYKNFIPGNAVPVDVDVYYGGIIANNFFLN